MSANDPHPMSSAHGGTRELAAGEAYESVTGSTLRVVELTKRGAVGYRRDDDPTTYFASRAVFVAAIR